MDMLGRLPLSAEKRVQVCLLWPLVTGLEGQCHQKHLLELGVWGAWRWSWFSLWPPSFPGTQVVWPWPSCPPFLNFSVSSCLLGLNRALLPAFAPSPCSLTPSACIQFLMGLLPRPIRGFPGLMGHGERRWSFYSGCLPRRSSRWACLSSRARLPGHCCGV